MTPVLVTGPVLPVVSLADMRAHLRIDGAEQDAEVAAIEKACVAYLDGWRGVLGRCLMPQTWRQDFTAWGRLRIAMPDASTFVVTYKDAAGAMVAFEGAEEGIDGLGPYLDAEGPDTALIRVQYQCAMPEEQLPAAQMAVKMYAEHMNDETDVPMAFHALVAAMRWRSV